jgi:hypothetical protein
MVTINSNELREATCAELELFSSIASERALRRIDPAEVTINDPEANELAKQYEFICSEIEMLEAQKESLKQELIKLTTSPKTRIGNVSVFKTFRKGSVDYSLIEQLKDIDLEKYRKKDVGIWQLRITN